MGDRRPALCQQQLRSWGCRPRASGWFGYLITWSAALKVIELFQRSVSSKAFGKNARKALLACLAAAAVWGGVPGGVPGGGSEPAAKRCRLGGEAGEAAAHGLQLLAQGLQLLYEAAAVPQVQAELAQHVQAAQRLLRPAGPLM